MLPQLSQRLFACLVQSPAGDLNNPLANARAQGSLLAATAPSCSKWDASKHCAAAALTAESQPIKTCSATAALQPPLRHAERRQWVGMPVLPSRGVSAAMRHRPDFEGAMTAM